MLQVLGAVVESSELHSESFHIELILSISACWRGEQSHWSFTDSPQGSKTKLPLVRRLPALTSGKAAGGVEGLCWSSCPVLRRAKSQGLDTGVKGARWAKQSPPSSQGLPHYLLTYLPMGCWWGTNEQCRLLWVTVLWCCCSTAVKGEREVGDHSLQLHLAALAQGLNQNLCHQSAALLLSALTVRDLGWSQCIAVLWQHLNTALKSLIF